MKAPSFSFKIKLAIGISILLIIFAVANRFPHKKIGSLAYVNQNTYKGVSDKNSTDPLVENTNINQTDLLGKELFTQYIATRQAGNLNATTTESIARDLASKIDENPDPYYKDKDIVVIQNPTKEDLKAYANKFWAIRSRYQSIFAKNIADNKDSIPTSADSVLIKSFILASNLYIDMANELIKLPVPRELAETHLQIVNNYYSSGQALQKLNKLEDDPYVTMVGLGVYRRYSDYENIITKIMARYFKESGIIFGSNDPGVGWNTL